MQKKFSAIGHFWVETAQLGAASIVPYMNQAASGDGSSEAALKPNTSTNGSLEAFGFTTRL
jgi:hypothetical protein